MPPAPSFQAVYTQHASLVRRVLAERGVQTADLDDAVQETFVVVDRLLPGFEGRSSIETWLHAIAWRVAANQRRRAKAVPTPASTELAASTDESPPSPAQVAQSMAGIDEEHRDLLVLHDVGELSISSLAQMTGHARATIRHRIARSRATLARALTRPSTRARRDTWLDALNAHFQNPRPPIPERELHVMSCRKVCISTLGDTVVAVWRGQSTSEGLHAVIDAMIAHTHAWPEGIRYLSIVERTSSPPGLEGRTMTTWCARRLGRKIKAAAAIVEGSALMGVVASFINASLVLAGEPVNFRFFASSHATLEWLAEHGPLDAHAMLEHIETMRASLAPAR